MACLMAIHEGIAHEHVPVRVELLAQLGDPTNNGDLCSMPNFAACSA